MASTAAQYFWLTVVLDPLNVLLATLFWWHWFGLHRHRWILRAVWLLTAARVLASLGAASPLFGLGFVPVNWLRGLNLLAFWSVATLMTLLLVILAEGFRRDRTEALLASVPMLLLVFISFQDYLPVLSGNLSVFGISIPLATTCYILMVLIIGILVLRRFLRTQVDQELARQALAQDLEQAHELQQRVLIPEGLPSRLFSVEAEYHPAQTVGGDFFQTISKPNGTLLVVIGDVSGKGISAAMLVAVLVGAIRTRADESSDPASLLHVLNQRLIGRSGGHFATCLAAEFRPDGSVTTANAGHLSPYLNGEELPVPPGLPLGISAEHTYEPITHQLRPGDRITYMSDGVVEARNPAGELFGFDRTQAICSQPARMIAEMAKKFGQEDDVTVLTVTRVPKLEAVPA